MNQTTLEQYAFAIGFDFELNSSAPGEVSEPTTLEAISIAIQTAGLPILESDRWDEFGQGRIFWGSKSECDGIKQVLSQFPVFLQEERNLDSGYYATETETYYADEAGNLYRVSTLDNRECNSLEPIQSIPLDAYRLRSLDPNLQSTVERSLSLHSQQPPAPEPVSLAIENSGAQQEALEQEINDLRAQLAQQVVQIHELEALKTAAVAAQASAEQDVNGLNVQLTQQSVHIHELERQVTVFEDQISSLQGTVASKVDSQQLDDLQAQFAQQTLHLQQLEARLAQAEGHVTSWERKAQQWIDPEEYAQIQQQLHSKTNHIQELEQRIQRQEQQLQDAVAVATRKVDIAKYQALEKKLTEQAAQGEEMKRGMIQLQRDLSEWQTVAESKVEWSEYQSLQQELQRLQLKTKKGWFSRIFARLFG
jgi:chromosome segregation ATPase